MLAQRAQRGGDRGGQVGPHQQGPCAGTAHAAPGGSRFAFAVARAAQAHVGAAL